MQNLSFIKAFLPTIATSVFLLSFYTQNVQAQTPTYKIEVIVFESLALKGWTEEYWPAEVALPDTSNSSSVFNTNKRPLFINNSSQSMAGKANALNKKGYRVLFHKAWTQLAYPNKNTTKTLLEASNKYGTNMLGTVRLYKTRFAHVNFDLHFDRRIPSKVRTSFANSQKMSEAELPSHWRFSLSESRKIRPGEFHYLDHPLFGVLVRITKLKTP